MKNWMKNIICSREWTDNGSGMDRVWSRMTSIKAAGNHVMILTFLLIVLGGFTTRAWGDVTRNYYAGVGVVGGGVAQVKMHWKWGASSGDIGPAKSNEAKPYVEETVTKTFESSIAERQVIYSVCSTDDGYHFDGWYDNSSCSGDASSKNSPWTERDYTKANFNITYYALFSPNTYTIAFNKNGATHGSTASAGATYDQNATLTSNGFYKACYSVDYNANGGTCDVTTDTSYYAFAGWKYNNAGVTYIDGATVRNLTATNDTTLNFYAQWGSQQAVTLPTPSEAPEYDGDGEYTFAGWYLSTDEATKTVVGIGGGSYTPAGNVTLKAKWTLTKEPGFSGADQTMKVGEGYSGFVFSNTSTTTPSSSSDDKFYYVISKDTVKTENTIGSPDGTKVIAVEIVDDVMTIRALNKGVASITFYQQADDDKNIAAGTSSTFKFTVDKNEPEFTWPASGTYYYNDTIEHFFKSSNTDTDIEVSPSPANIATIVDSALVTYNRAGTTTITMTQAENYYWKEYSEYRTITPQNIANHVPFVYTEAMKNNASITTTGVNTKISWDDYSHLWLENDGNGGTWDDKYVILKIEGYPDSLKFVHRTSNGSASGADWYIKASIDNVSWPDTNVWSINRNASGWSDTVRLKLNPATRYLKLCYSGNYHGYYNTITVSEFKQFSIDTDELDFETNLRGSSPDPQKVTFTHTNACYSVNVESSDETHYQVGLSASGPWKNSVVVPNTGGDKMGTQDIYVKYIPTTALEEETHNANITISDLDSTQTISVTGTTQRYLATRLVYTGSKSYNANNDNIAATAVFTLYDANDVEIADPAITLSSSNTGVINIVEDYTEMDFVCSNADSITITASYDGDGETYASTSKTQKILVNKAADVITWSNKVVNDTLRVHADSIIDYSIASAHTTADKPITFTSGDATIVSVTPGAMSDAMSTLKYDTVRLTATTTADCTYSSVTSSIVVVVLPCQHRIVWTDDFAGLHTEEDGTTIDYTSDPMSAYAVDSTGASTGVTISYSLSPGTTIAEIDKDNKLHITGVGETMVYATTAADDKYAVVTDSLVIRVLAWGENHAKIEQEEFNGNRKWSGAHADFEISGDGMGTTTFGGDGRKLTLTANTEVTVSWTVDPGCTINVTKINCKFGNAAAWGSDYDIYFDNSKIGNCGGWSTVDNIGLSDLSLGNDGSIKIKTTRDANIYYIDITYTITPTNAPTPTEGVSEVYVTVDPESPVLLDISDVFSIADAPSDFTYVCDTIEKNSHVHFAEGQTKFWADAIGDYTIKGRVAAASDHRSSAWSSTYKTIRVVRQPNTLYVGGVADYSGNMQLNSTLALALTASNTDYAGSPISVVQIRGADTISYNQSTGQVTSSTVEGTGMWRISQAQSDKYLAAEATFTVNVVANDKTYSGGAIDWTDKDEVTVSADVTIDEPIEVFKLKISSGTTVTVTASGGLSIGMGGIVNSSDNNIKLESNTDGQTGFLRIDPEYAGAMPEVDVEMYSKAYHDNTAASGSKSKYQCVGAPISDEGVRANTVYPAGTWIYTWNESTEGWTSCRTSMTFEAFKGFETTQKLAAAGKNYTYSGHIVSGHEVKTIDLDYSAEEKGYNLLANSFTAPIDIASFDVDAEDGEVDFVNAQQTIYFLNAGTKNQSASPGAGVDAPGKWVGVPIKTADKLAEDGLPRMIPSMQGFWVKTTGANAQLKLDYSRLVWGIDYSGIRENKPLRARKQDTEEEQPITGKLKISITAEEGNDYLFMLESERYDAAYEDGYDAYKIPSGGVDIFAVEGEDELGVDATNTLIGTKIGLRTGEEYAYTMKFSRVQAEDDLALLDKEEGKEIDIEEGTEYAFFATQNATITDRFEIVSRGNAPAITTGTDGVNAEVKAQKFIKNNSLYIYKDGVLYNALGERVR